MNLDSLIMGVFWTTMMGTLIITCSHLTFSGVERTKLTMEKRKLLASVIEGNTSSSDVILLTCNNLGEVLTSTSNLFKSGGNITRVGTPETLGSLAERSQLYDVSNVLTFEDSKYIVTAKKISEGTRIGMIKF
tara:strand:+ start:352 stop:750 length:399 start_codon:yes stop_codon:yes gene_type:complete